MIAVRILKPKLLSHSGLLGACDVPLSLHNRTVENNQCIISGLSVFIHRHTENHRRLVSDPEKQQKGACGILISVVIPLCGPQPGLH